MFIVTKLDLWKINKNCIKLLQPIIILITLFGILKILQLYEEFPQNIKLQFTIE